MEERTEDVAIRHLEDINTSATDTCQLLDRILQFLEKIEENTRKPKRRSPVRESHINMEKGSPQHDQFVEWYGKYSKKVGRTEAEKSWSRLTEEECKACLEVVDEFVKSKPDPQYRPNPATYLNQRRWEDEIIAPEPKYKSKTKYVSDEEGVYKCEKCGKEKVQTLQAHQPRPRCCGENMLRRFDV